MKFFLFEGEVDAKGTILEWVLMKTQFWILFTVHVVLISVCCFKTCKFAYEIFYIIHHADQLDNMDDLNESLLDGLEGDLARSNSEVIRQLIPVHYSELDTDAKECCICTLRFDGASSKGARSVAGNWQNGATNEVEVLLNGKMTKLYHDENGVIDIERWKEENQVALGQPTACNRCRQANLQQCECNRRDSNLSTP